MEHHKPIGREFTPLCYRHPGLDSSMAAGFADGRSRSELIEMAIVQVLPVVTTKRFRFCCIRL